MFLRASSALANMAKRAISLSSVKLAHKKYDPCEKTFMMVKPDGVQRGRVGKIISRFEERGYKLIGMKMTEASEETVKKHYPDLVSKPFFPELSQYIRSGPVIPMVWQGKNIVAVSRMMIGKTNPMESDPGTIRGDYGLELDRNIIHGSSDVASGQKEIGNWFKPEEVLDYDMLQDVWVYSDSVNT